MRNIFVEKSCAKCGGETIPRLLSKKSKLSISLAQQCKVLNSLFLLYVNLRVIEISEIKLQTTCLAAYFSYLKLFKKTKSGLELVSLTHFLHDF